jgi:hypothetical protein
LPNGRTIPGGNVTIPGFCTLTVNVTAPSKGEFLNEVPVNALNTTGGNNTASPAVVILSVILAPRTATTAVPTLSEWGAIILVGLLGLVSIYYLRRQRP